MSRSFLFVTAAALLITACDSEQDRVARAAAARVATTKVLAPDDLQITSGDNAVILEVIGDSVFVVTANSTIGAPATQVENLKYEGGRLRFDLTGFGLQIFEVGDGTNGAVFSPEEALAFVSTVLERQNTIERKR
jgi:hypothetical protein